MTPETILRFNQLCAMLSIHRSTAYRLLAADPTFPRPIALSARTVGFLRSEVDAWLEQRRQATAAKGIA